MDVAFILFFLFVSALFSILGLLLKSPGTQGIGAIGLVLTGLMVILGGIDVQSQYQVTSNFTARDDYAYSWNNTFNVSRLDNVTTAYMNKTLVQNYSYYNYTDNYTRAIALLIAFGGLASGFAALGSRKNDETNEES